MVSATDYPRKPGGLGAREGRSKQLHFRLFAALAAPFKDIDERALYQKLARTEARNNSKDNSLVTCAAPPTKVLVKSFPRGGD